MSTLRILYHIARADFLERTRRYSFLIVLGLVIFLGFSINRGDFYLELDGYRGVLNSAWVGGMMAASSTFMLTLFGFYLVKNAIERDIQTGVGQIIATTPISRSIYLLGKWLSNWAVLSALLAILLLAAVVMQLLGGESSGLDLWQLLAPFFWLVLPALAIVAAIALLFETIPWLRGGLGNVLYFFVWSFALIFALESKVLWYDWSGIVILWKSMGAALMAVYPGYSGGFNFTGEVLPAGGLKTFDWSGIHWTTEIVLSRLVWLIGAVGLTVTGSFIFQRFDPSHEKVKMATKSAAKDGNGDAGEVRHSERGLPPVRLGTLAAGSRRFNFVRILAAELRLLLKGLPWWWVVVAAGLVLVPLFVPLEEVRKGYLPAAWIWFILLWSGLGCRESRYATHQVVFSAAHPIAYQLPATWLAGFLVTALAGSGAALRLLMAGETAGLLGWLGGAVFIPSLALALGVWSGSGKAFEVVYMLWWYLGPLHPLAMPALDFTGVAGQNYWQVYILMSIGLVLLALLGRVRQLRS